MNRTALLAVLLLVAVGLIAWEQRLQRGELVALGERLNRADIPS